MTSPPTYVGNYSVAAQAFVAPPPNGGSAVVYQNDFSNGFLSTTGIGTSFMDWGTLSAGGFNDITDFQIGYGTANPDPFGSGVVDLLISLHEGATGNGDPGTTISSFLVTGLPGSVSGGFEGFIVDVTLPGPVKIPDGGIGYSYEAVSDNDTGPLTIGPPNEAGVIDAFDVYTPTGGAYAGTFNFGGVPFASFWAVLTGVRAECFIVIGNDNGLDTFGPLVHDFTTQVGEIQSSYEVLLDDYPSFYLPESKTGRSMFGSVGSSGNQGSVVTPDFMADGEFSVQIVMWNPWVFPGQPEQYTQALKVYLKADGSVKTRKFGTDLGGMDVWADVGVDAQGKKVISFPFSIDGM